MEEFNDQLNAVKTNKSDALYLSGLIVAIVAIALSSFQLYTAVFGIYKTAVVHRAVHLLLVLILFYLINPLSKNQKFNKIGHYIDTGLIILSLLSAGYVVLFYDFVANRIGDLKGLTNLDLFFGILIILLVVETSRRVNLIFFSLAVLSLFYMLLGPYFPGLLAHPGISPERLVYLLAYSSEGIFGTALAVSSTYLFLFILLGAFMEHTGVSNFFLDFSHSLVGKYRGGPAKTAVIASSLMGTVMGSSIANVASTGSFTIPLMKKNGFKDYVAGAIEAVASSGGQLLPPVMGAGAFIMAEITGIPYPQIALAALLPALIFYICVFMIVHFEAVKSTEVTGETVIQKGNFKTILLSSGYMLLPLVTLAYLLLVTGYTATKAGVIAILACVVVANVKKSTRLQLKVYLEILKKGALNAVEIASLCASMGIVIGAVTLTGLGMRFTSIVIHLAGGELLPLLLLTMVVCLILGMGLPTPVAYLVMAIFAAPALVEMGIPLVAAHLFVFYYAIISGVSPPIAIVSTVAAGIAQSDWLKTTLAAFRFSLISFIIPFMFVYNPQLLMIGEWSEILPATVTAIAGSVAMAAAIQGVLLTRASMPERLTLFAASLTLIKPGFSTDLVGASLLAIIILIQIYKNRKSVSGSEVVHE